MKALNIASSLAVIVGLAIFGWISVTKPDALIEWRLRHYPSHYPWARTFRKPWFRTYLQIGGVCLWLFDVLALYILLGGKLP